MSESENATSDIKEGINEYDRFYGAQDFNPSTRNVKLPVEIKHAFANWQFIHDNVKSGRGKDLQTVNVQGKEPALIMGSGPTLDKFGPLLKEWKGAVFASSSQAITCAYYGHAPEYIVTLDPHTELIELESIDDWDKYDSTLITHPCVAPSLVQGWPKESLYYRPMEPSSEFHSMHLSIGYGDIIGTYCLLFSCTPSAQIAIARMMGYNPLYMVGLDFGFPKYERRFTSWYYHELEGWLHEKPVPSVDEDDKDFKTDNPYRRLIYAENGCCTSVMHIYYKRAFICVANIDMSDIFKVKTYNAVIEFPEISKEELIRTQGHLAPEKFWSKKKKQTKYEDYLARFFTFPLRYKNGSLSYFECQPVLTPESDVPPLLKARLESGEKIGVNEQIEMFVRSNYIQMKNQEKNIQAQTGQTADDILDPDAEITRIQKLHKRAEAHRAKYKGVRLHEKRA